MRMEVMDTLCWLASRILLLYHSWASKCFRQLSRKCLFLILFVLVFQRMYSRKFQVRIHLRCGTHIYCSVFVSPTELEITSFPSITCFLSLWENTPLTTLYLYSFYSFGDDFRCSGVFVSWQNDSESSFFCSVGSKYDINNYIFDYCF